MTRNRKAIAGAALLGLAMGVSACGGSSNAASKSSTLVVADVDLDTLVPAATELAFSEEQELFAPIVAFNPDGSLVYVQSQSIKASNGDKVFTITFRPGWTFHNGEPVTAQSYADGWNFTAYKGNANPNASELAEIAGYNAVNPATGNATAKTLSGVKVLSKYVLQVTLTTPDSQFPDELTIGDTGFFPMPKAGLSNVKAFAKNPIGDGPFQMNGVANLNAQVAMKAYPNYKGKKPAVKFLTFKLFSNPDTAYTATQAGTVGIDSAPQSKFSQIKSNFGSRVVDVPGESLDFLGFPLFDKRWQNPKLRQAISLAIDRPSIIKALLGGQAQPADGLLAPGLLGGGAHQCDYCTFDPAKAKQLFTQAGGWSGPMVISYPGGAGYDQEFQAIANQLQQNLGIASVRATPAASFSAYFTALTKKQYTDGPFRGHWGSLYPSAANILSSIFVPNAPFDSSTGFYSNPKVTSLITAGNAAGSPADAVADYQQAAKTILDDVAVVPLFYPTYPTVYASNVHNVHALPHQIGIDYDSVTVG